MRIQLDKNKNIHPPKQTNLIHPSLQKNTKKIHPQGQNTCTHVASRHLLDSRKFFPAPRACSNRLGALFSSFFVACILLSRGIVPPRQAGLRRHKSKQKVAPVFCHFPSPLPLFYAIFLKSIIYEFHPYPSRDFFPWRYLFSSPYTPERVT